MGWHDQVQGKPGSSKSSSENVHTVSREELYEQVLSQPMTKVAAEYGVTKMNDGGKRQPPCVMRTTLRREFGAQVIADPASTETVALAAR